MSFSASPTRPVAGPSCFPLAKFSFATVSGDFVRPIPWTHIPDKGHLFAVFENISLAKHDGNAEHKSQFKVLAEPELMVRFDESFEPKEHNLLILPERVNRRISISGL